MAKEKRVVMSVSGGADSSTMLAYLLSEGFEVHCVWFDYGSTQNPYEMKAIQAITDHYKVPLSIISIKDAMSDFKSALTRKQDIPEGYYNKDNMSATVVPARNIVFISLAAGFAWSIDYNYVALAIHSGDHFVYPDTRPEFYNAMKEAIFEGTDKRITLLAPFLYYDKRDIIRKGLELNVPYELTRTCYKDQPVACGRCGACVERLEAFWLNGAEDPIEYEDREYWKTVSKEYK